MAQHRQLSMSVYDRQKSERINRIRQEEQRVSMDLKRKSSEMEAKVQEQREAAK